MIQISKQALTASDYIQIFGIIVSLIIAVVSFIFTAKSISQVSKAQRDMARPYINMFVDRVAVKNVSAFYVIKNFGTSPAFIKDIKVVDGQLDSLNNRHKFKSLIGCQVAPGQKFTSVFDNKEDNIAVIEIIYEDIHKKEYTDIFRLNTKTTKDLLYSVPEDNNSKMPSSSIRQSTMALLRELR